MRDEVLTIVFNDGKHLPEVDTKFLILNREYPVYTCRFSFSRNFHKKQMLIYYITFAFNWINLYFLMLIRSQNYYTCVETFDICIVLQHLTFEAKTTRRMRFPLFIYG